MHVTLYPYVGSRWYEGREVFRHPPPATYPVPPTTYQTPDTRLLFFFPTCHLPPTVCHPVSALVVPESRILNPESCSSPPTSFLFNNIPAFVA